MKIPECTDREFIAACLKGTKPLGNRPVPPATKERLDELEKIFAVADELLPHFKECIENDHTKLKHSFDVPAILDYLENHRHETP